MLEKSLFFMLVMGVLVSLSFRYKKGSLARLTILGLVIIVMFGMIDWMFKI